MLVMAVELEICFSGHFSKDLALNDAHLCLVLPRVVQLHRQLSSARLSKPRVRSVAGFDWSSPSITIDKSSSVGRKADLRIILKQLIVFFMRLLHVVRRKHLLHLSEA